MHDFRQKIITTIKCNLPGVFHPEITTTQKQFRYREVFATDLELKLCVSATKAINAWSKYI